jgi:hypothetical protein
MYQLNAATRLLALSKINRSEEYLNKLISSEGYKNFIACTDDLRGTISRSLAIKAILNNIQQWFEGYLGHPSKDWDANSLFLMKKHLKTVQKYYPSKIPKIVYRATMIPNSKGLSSPDLLGDQNIPEFRQILSFSGDPNYPRTFWKRVRGKSEQEVTKDPYLLKNIKVDCASVVYKVSVSTTNLVGSYDSCVSFIEAVRTYYDGWLHELMKINPNLTWGNVGSGAKITNGMKSILRPFIKRQKEVILTFPSNKVKGTVVDVISNTVDIRRKFQKKGKV